MDEQPSPGDAQHFSRDAYDRLRKEYEWRSGERRSEISQWIERAREHGDIRENADFDAAKNEQGLNEGRIRHLNQMIKAAVVVDNADTGVVTPGSIVEIRMSGDDETTLYLVGSIEERHDTYDVLSSSSPLGKVLLGAKPGDTVEFDGPRRSFEVEVVSVRSIDA